MTPHRPRTRHYAPRPEVVRIDWPSAFKIAVAVVVLTTIAHVVVGFLFGAGIAVLAAATL